MTDGEWFDTLFRRPHFQDTNKSKPQTKHCCTHTYLTNGHQKAGAKQLKAWWHVSATPGFEGRRIPSSKPARATQRVCESKHTEANKRCTSGLSNCPRQLFVCRPPMCEKEPLQVDAAGSSRAVEFPSATHTHTPFKNDQVVGTNLQKAIADCITKRGTVTRVLPPVPWKGNCPRPSPPNIPLFPSSLEKGGGS